MVPVQGIMHIVWQIPGSDNGFFKNYIERGICRRASLYEVTPLLVNGKTDNVGDASELERILELAEAADRTSQEYENAPQELKGAF